MIKNIFRTIGSVAVIALAANVAGAQTLQSGYFDDNYLYRYQANPAMGNDGKFFISFPGLGNINLGTNGTINLDHIFHVVNGETTTLLNPNISASEALDGMKDLSRLGIELRETILALGFKGFKGYNTITLSARGSASIGMPKDLIRLAKEGLSNDTYDLGQFGATGRVWGELALNHSHRINNQLTIGATLKFLVGVGSFDANVKTANLHFYKDNYIFETNAEISSSIKGFRYETDYNDETHREYVSGAELDDFSAPNGFGAAVDLGAIYTLNKDWEFSLAFTDLGFIKWDNNVVATTNGLQQIESNNYHFNVDNNDTWDEFSKNVSMLYELEDKGDTGSRMTGIGATMTAGAQYSLPVYRKLKFGLMNTTRIYGDWSWTEFRLSANIRPVRFISLGANVAYGTFGAHFGAILNFRNFFIATDCIPGKLAKQYAPLNSNMNLNLGFNIAF